MQKSGTISGDRSTPWAWSGSVRKHPAARAEAVLPETFATYLERLNIERRGLRGDRSLAVDPTERSSDPHATDARQAAGEPERSAVLGPSLGVIERAPARAVTYEQDVRVVRAVYVPAGNLIDVFA
ncbi:MAG: hypothetical protein AAGD00_06935 [Planctomycetota bacterium]